MPLDHQVHRPAQPEVIEVAFQEIVLSSPINRLFRYIFVFHAAENQNRNVWRGGPQLFKRHHPSSVGHFDVYDDAAHLPLWMRSTPSDSFLKLSTWKPSCASFCSALVINRASVGWHSINSTDSFFGWFIPLPSASVRRRAGAFTCGKGVKGIKKARAWF
jgi:hypothetical protein